MGGLVFVGPFGVKESVDDLECPVCLHSAQQPPPQSHAPPPYGHSPSPPPQEWHRQLQEQATVGPRKGADMMEDDDTGHEQRAVQQHASKAGPPRPPPLPFSTPRGGFPPPRGRGSGPPGMGPGRPDGPQGHLLPTPGPEVIPRSLQQAMKQQGGYHLPHYPGRQGDSGDRPGDRGAIPINPPGADRSGHGSQSPQQAGYRPPVSGNHPTKGFPQSQPFQQQQHMQGLQHGGSQMRVGQQHHQPPPESPYPRRPEQHCSSPAEGAVRQSQQPPPPSHAPPPFGQSPPPPPQEWYTRAHVSQESPASPYDWPPSPPQFSGPMFENEEENLIRMQQRLGSLRRPPTSSPSYTSRWRHPLPRPLTSCPPSPSHEAPKRQATWPRHGSPSTPNGSSMGEVLSRLRLYFQQIGMGEWMNGSMQGMQYAYSQSGDVTQATVCMSPTASPMAAAAVTQQDGAFGHAGFPACLHQAAMQGIASQSMAAQQHQQQQHLPQTQGQQLAGQAAMHPQQHFGADATPITQRSHSGDFGGVNTKKRVANAPLLRGPSPVQNQSPSDLPPEAHHTPAGHSMVALHPSVQQQQQRPQQEIAVWPAVDGFAPSSPDQEPFPHQPIAPPPPPAAHELPTFTKPRESQEAGDMAAAQDTTSQHHHQQQQQRQKAPTDEARGHGAFPPPVILPTPGEQPPTAPHAHELLPYHAPATEEMPRLREIGVGTMDPLPADGGQAAAARSLSGSDSRQSSPPGAQHQQVGRERVERERDDQRQPRPSWHPSLRIFNSSIKDVRKQTRQEAAGAVSLSGRAGAAGRAREGGEEGHPGPADVTDETEVEGGPSSGPAERQAGAEATARPKAPGQFAAPPPAQQESAQAGGRASAVPPAPVHRPAPPEPVSPPRPPSAVPSTDAKEPAAAAAAGAASSSSAPPAPPPPPPPPPGPSGMMGSQRSRKPSLRISNAAASRPSPSTNTNTTNTTTTTTPTARAQVAEDTEDVERAACEAAIDAALALSPLCRPAASSDTPLAAPAAAPAAARSESDQVEAPLRAELEQLKAEYERVQQSAAHFSEFWAEAQQELDAARQRVAQLQEQLKDAQQGWQQAERARDALMFWHKPGPRWGWMPRTYWEDEDDDEDDTRSDVTEVEISELQQEIDRLLRERNALVKQSQQREAELQGQIEGLLEERQESEKSRIALAEELDATRQSQQTLREVLHTLREELQTLRRKSREEEDLRTFAASTLAAEQAKELETLKQQNTALLQEQASWLTLFSTKLNEAEKLRDVLSSMQQDNEAAAAAVSTQQEQRIRYLDEERASLVAANQQLQGDKEGLVQKVKALQSDLAAVRTPPDLSAADWESTADVPAARRPDTAVMETQTDGVGDGERRTERVEDGGIAVEALQAEIKQLTEEKSSVQSELMERIRQIDELKTRETELSADLQQEHDERRAETDRWVQQFAALREEKAAMIQSLSEKSQQQETELRDRIEQREVEAYRRGEGMMEGWLASEKARQESEKSRIALAEELDATKQSQQTLREELHTLREELQTLRRNSREEEDLRTFAASTLAAEQAKELDTLKQQNTALLQEQTLLSTKLNEAEKLREALSSMQQDNEAAAAQLEQKAIDLERVVKDKDDIIQEREAEILALRDTAAVSTQQEQRIRDLDEERASLVAANQELQGDKEGLVQKVKALQSDLAAVSTQPNVPAANWESTADVPAARRPDTAVMETQTDGVGDGERHTERIDDGGIVVEALQEETKQLTEEKSSLQLELMESIRQIDELKTRETELSANLQLPQPQEQLAGQAAMLSQQQQFGADATSTTQRPHSGDFGGVTTKKRVASAPLPRCPPPVQDQSPSDQAPAGHSMAAFHPSVQQQQQRPQQEIAVWPAVDGFAPSPPDQQPFAHQSMAPPPPPAAHELPTFTKPRGTQEAGDMAAAQATTSQQHHHHQQQQQRSEGMVSVARSSFHAGGGGAAVGTDQSIPTRSSISGEPLHSASGPWHQQQPPPIPGAGGRLRMVNGAEGVDLRNLIMSEHHRQAAMQVQQPQQQQQQGGSPPRVPLTPTPRPAGVVTPPHLRVAVLGGGRGEEREGSVQWVGVPSPPPNLAGRVLPPPPGPKASYVTPKFGSPGNQSAQLSPPSAMPEPNRVEAPVGAAEPVVKLGEVSQRLTGASQQVPSSAPSPPFPPVHGGPPPPPLPHRPLLAPPPLCTPLFASPIHAPMMPPIMAQQQNFLPRPPPVHMAPPYLGPSINPTLTHPTIEGVGRLQPPMVMMPVPMQRPVLPGGVAPPIFGGGAVGMRVAAGVGVRGGGQQLRGGGMSKCCDVPRVPRGG
ncbi:unnamed protein product [Vitrella brassicaformis CCMP3155]|uniref:Uncharacterized protein n=1 Tax=Vitrella brassicaformis (strain CCMP3155) TaxID=1169540 RepID=A0A0G4E9X0_VITBC|nr:unnamed protein product [Vitrella brassicaformis CCMP3155]|eukprot:CEL92447.1 unnamed protein product [Vitrella brassicaformis CCMP3155]